MGSDQTQRSKASYDSHREAASLCLLSTPNVFLGISIPPPISQEVTQRNRLHNAINVHFDSIHVTIHNHVL